MGKHGIQHPKPPLRDLRWLDMEYKQQDSLDKMVFDVNQGLYSLDQIQGFNTMMIFNGRQNTVLGKITEQINPEVFTNPTDTIQPQDMFRDYPWDGIIETITNTFEVFGRWCSICIGILTIASIIKNGLIYVKGCCIVKEKFGAKATAQYAVSPLYFILRQVQNDRKKEEPRQYLSLIHI